MGLKMYKNFAQIQWKPPEIKVPRPFYGYVPTDDQSLATTVSVTSADAKSASCTSVLMRIGHHSVRQGYRLEALLLTYTPKGHVAILLIAFLGFPIITCLFRITIYMYLYDYPRLS